MYLSGLRHQRETPENSLSGRIPHDISQRNKEATTGCHSIQTGSLARACDFPLRVNTIFWLNLVSSLAQRHGRWANDEATFSLVYGLQWAGHNYVHIMLPCVDIKQ